MKTWGLLLAVMLVITEIVTPVVAQTGGAPEAQRARSTTNANADIKKAQEALKQNGHDPGVIDGVIGPHTSAALRAYQKDQGLSITGRLDDDTQAKLEPRSRTPHGQPGSGSSGSQPTAGDPGKSAVDPAEAHKTGANVGEGASYNRSNETGQSTADQKK